MLYLTIKDLLLWADKNNPKRELNYIYVDRASLSLVATNTKVIAKITFTCKDELEAVLLLPRMADEVNARIEVISKNGFITRIDGKYPDYERIIPESILSRDGVTYVEGGLCSREFYTQGVCLNPYDKDLTKPLGCLFEGGIAAYVCDERSPVHFSGPIKFGDKKSGYVNATLRAAVMPFLP